MRLSEEQGVRWSENRCLPPDHIGAGRLELTDDLSQTGMTVLVHDRKK
jgi:hypothetical protein